MFKLEEFDIKLDTGYIGRKFIYAEEAESTNAVLVDQKSEFKDNGTVLLAEKQTQGRGRGGRAWHSIKDLNLTFSILLTDASAFREKLTLIIFGTANVVASAIENLYQLRTEVKWPNDILVNGKKIAGILLESSTQGNKVNKIVVGIGINVNQNSFPGQFAIEPTSLKLELDQVADRETLLAEVLNIFEEMLEKLRLEPEQILKEWRMRCRMLGEKIEVTDGSTSKYGIFDDVDTDGTLLLKTNKGIERINYGDVSLR